MQIVKTLNSIVYIAVLLVLFFGGNVLKFLGYDVGGENAPGYQKLHPSFYLMVLIMALFVMYKVEIFGASAIKKDRSFLFAIIGVLVYMTVNRLTFGIAFIPNNLILPVLISLYLAVSNQKFLSRIHHLLISFFIINSAVAILEKLVSFHFFPIEIERGLDFSGFRSTALQGHPLNNALVTSIIISFILFSSMSQVRKYLLFFLGFTSIICYGSRSSLIMSMVAFIVFYVYDMFLMRRRKSKQGSRLVINFLIVAISGSLLILTVATGFGERLMNHASLTDDSANVRLQALGIFGLIGRESFLWGTSANEIDYLKYMIDLNVIENFWIIWILRFGLIVTIILSFFFLKFLWNLLKSYAVWKRILLIFIFLGIASTYNSLAVLTMAVTIFVLCSYVLSPQYSNFLGSKIHSGGITT